YPRLPRPGRRPVPSRAGNASRGPPAPGLDSHGQGLAYRLVEAQASAHQGLNLLCGERAASLEQCGIRKGRDTMDRAALDAGYAAATHYLEGLRARPVGAAADAAAMRDALAGPLPEQGEPAARIVEELARKADPGIVASGGPRFFGFVIGGSVPAALAADWLSTAWDQNAGLFVLSPQSTEPTGLNRDSSAGAASGIAHRSGSGPTSGST